MKRILVTKLYTSRVFWMISSTLTIWFQLDSGLRKIGLAIINGCSCHFCSVSWRFQKLPSNCSPKLFFWRRQLYVIQTWISWYFPSINSIVVRVHSWMLSSASKKVTVLWKGVRQQTFTGFTRKKLCLNRQIKGGPNRKSVRIFAHGSNASLVENEEP